jgi:hypothetical protein
VMRWKAGPDNETANDDASKQRQQQHPLNVYLKGNFPIPGPLDRRCVHGFLNVIVLAVRTVQVPQQGCPDGTSSRGAL